MPPKVPPLSCRTLSKTSEERQSLRNAERQCRQSCYDYMDDAYCHCTKKGGSLRSCIDYRKLNAVTVEDSYPIPQVNESVDSHGTANVFSGLDTVRGYMQIEQEENNMDKTAVLTQNGLNGYSRTSFGLRSASAALQRAMDNIFAPVEWQYAFVHIDNVVVFSKPPEGI